MSLLFYLTLILSGGGFGGERRGVDISGMLCATTPKCWDILQREVGVEVVVQQGFCNSTVKASCNKSDICPHAPVV